MLIPGFATFEGTERYHARFRTRLPNHFRRAHNLWISSIGLGTYLGEPTATYDQLYTDAVMRAAQAGVNHFDSAINYRHQRSERSIGKALAAMFEAGTLRRDEVVLATKGGFLTFDGDEPADPAAYFEEKLISTGLVKPEDVAAGCHVMAPAYLENQIEQSRQNLGVGSIDIYYIHNPETQLGDVSREEFYRRLRAAFETLERAVADGKIRLYGTATWNAYRVGPEAREAIALVNALAVAREVGGDDHHFRAVQLPFSFAMPEALVAPTQEWENGRAPFLEVARARRLMVFASASIMQGHLAKGLPMHIRNSFPREKSDAQRAIQFVRSTPGITCALVGMCQRDHVDENLGTATVAPLTPEEFRAKFSK
ncbi:MAG: aldo/keto reductase [Terriglobia bacterium]